MMAMTMMVMTIMMMTIMTMMLMVMMMRKEAPAAVPAGIQLGGSAAAFTTEDPDDDQH